MALGLALVLAGCREDSPTDPEIELTLETYFPLSVGNKWVWQETCSTSTSCSTYTDSFYIAEKYSWNGKNVYRAEGRIMGLVGDRAVYYGKDLRVYSNPPEQDSTSYSVILQEPIEKGHTWKDGFCDYEIISIDATKTVSAGTFKKCIRVSFQTDGYFFCAQNVGLIYSRRHWFFSTLYKYNLIRYTVN
jgi:hypothetical protein